MSSTSQTTAIAVAVIMLASLAPMTAVTAQTDGDDDVVPVEYTSAANAINLHFWRTGDSVCNSPDSQATPAGDTPGPGTCVLRAEDVPTSSGQSPDPDRETRAVVLGEEEPDANEVARFALDTGGDEVGADFPFTIKRSSGALKIDFWYESQTNCDPFIEAGQAFTFDVTVYKASADQSQPGQGEPIASGSQEDCGLATQAHRVSFGMDLDQAVTVAEGEFLVVDISARSTGDVPGATWTLLFEDASRDSQLTVRTDQAVQKAIWATDLSGTFQETFDPNAPLDDRYLIPRMALRSPFGSPAVPSEGFTGEILDPDGDLVALNSDGQTVPASEDRITAAGMPALSTHAIKDGARQVFKMDEIPASDNPAGDDVEPWHYIEGVQAGAYTLRVSGDLLGNSETFTQQVAMGGFDFTLGPVDDEQTVHQLNRDSSTTFILELTNDADVRDTYQLDTEFIFSSRDTTWTVDLLGVDQNDRITLEPGENALIRVKLTPPSGAVSGDAARVTVTAESLASTAEQAVNLEGQVTTTTVRATGLLVLQDPFTIGIDRQNTITVFAWNKGTATDSFTASIVEGTLSNTDTSQFDVELKQSRVDNVAPGDVASIPIEITTGSQVTGNQSFSFDVQVKSVAAPSATDTRGVDTVVKAIRSFDLSGVNGANEQATKSLRYGKTNNSGEGLPLTCEQANDDNPEECGLYTRYAFHRFTLDNTGNQPEAFDMSIVGTSSVKAPGSCSALFGSDDFEADLIESIDTTRPANVRESQVVDTIEVDPGETKRFYLRVEYPGEEVTGDCEWHKFIAGVRATPEDGSGTPLPARIIETTTQIFDADQLDDMPNLAQARLALSEVSIVDGTSQLVDRIPDQVAVEPGQQAQVNFTLSEQSGQEDQVRVTLGPSDKIEDLRDQGWEISLTTRDGTNFTEPDEGPGILLPANNEIGEGREDAPNAATAIGHSAGAEYPLAMVIDAPTTGLQEDERHFLTVRAQSLTDPNRLDDLSIDVQVGKDFDFELERGQPSVDAHPGDTVAFGLTVNNTGATRDTYDIDISAPGSFDQPTVQPSSLSVSPTSSKASAITVQVPDGAQVGSSPTITATVTSQADPDDPDDSQTAQATYTINVRAAGSLTMEAEEELVRVGPGGNTTVNYTISNQASDDVTVELSEIFSPPGWTTTLSSSNTTLEVPGGGSRDFQYLVEAPADITEGSRYSFTVKVTDIDDTSNFANGVAFAVVQGETAVSLEAEEQRVVVDRGETNTFPVLVRNLGTGVTWYHLTTQLETQGWSANVLDQDGNDIGNDTIRVPEQSFERVLIEVGAPTDAATDHVEEVGLTASAVGGGTDDRIILEAVVHDFAIDIELEGSATQDVAPGDDAEFLVSVTNTGNGADTVRFDFTDTTGAEPEYAVSTDLSDDETPELEAGETLSGVRVIIEIPSPNQGPVPTPDGVTTLVRGSATGSPEDTGTPTDSVDVTTRLVPYVRLDIDGDGAFEVALDMNRNSEDGFEVFADKDEAMVQRGEISEGDTVTSEDLYQVDADEDDRTEHLVDTDGNGISDLYFDPDKAQTSQVPYTTDINGDQEPEEPIDSDFDGLLDKLYDTSQDRLMDVENLDFSGDGRRDLLIDSDGDGAFDTFVDPNEDPHVVSSAEKDGDVYKMDTDGDGKVDTHYNVQSGEISTATTSNLGNFFSEYWYFVVLFLIVAALFVVIVVRRV